MHIRSNDFMHTASYFAEEEEGIIAFVKKKKDWFTVFTAILMQKKSVDHFVNYL